MPAFMIFILIQSLIQTCLLFSLCERKSKSGFFYALMVFAAIFLLGWRMEEIKASEAVYCVLAPLLGFLFLTFTGRYGTFHRLCLSAIYVTVRTIVRPFVVVFLGSILLLQADSIRLYSLYPVQAFGLRLFLEGLFCFLIAKTILKQKTVLQEKDCMLILAAMVTMMVMMNALDNLIYRHYYIQSDVTVCLVSIVAFAVILVILLLRMHRDSVRTTALEYEHQLIQQQLQQRDEQFAMQEELQVIRHDIVHMLGLLAAQNDEELTNARIRYTEKAAGMDLPIATGSQAINLVLNVKRAEARRRGIDFKTQVSLDPAVKIDDQDVYVILCSLLDKAITSIGQERKIEVVLNAKYPWFFFRVSSSCDQMFMEPMSLGLRTVDNITQRHEGNLDVELKDGVLTACGSLDCTSYEGE